MASMKARVSLVKLFRNLYVRTQPNRGFIPGLGPLISSPESIEKAVQSWEKQVEFNKLTAGDKKIHQEHLQALKEKKEVYIDPETGYEVHTMLAHFKRGYCCGNACRHCPFFHSSVEAKSKGKKTYNTAFHK